MPFIYSCSTLSDNGIPTTSSSSFFLRPCLCCHLKTTLLLLLLLLLRVLSASFEFIEFACAAKGGGGMVLLVGVVDTSSAWKEKEKEPWPAKWVSVINAISAQECPIPQ